MLLLETFSQKMPNYNLFLRYEHTHKRSHLSPAAHSIPVEMGDEITRNSKYYLIFFSLSLAINVDKDISFTSNYMREEIVCERKNKRNVSRAAYLPRCGACQPRVRFQNPNERHIPREYTRRRGRFTEKSKYRSLAFLFFSNCVFAQHSTQDRERRKECWKKILHIVAWL